MKNLILIFSILVSVYSQAQPSYSSREQEILTLIDAAIDIENQLNWGTETNPLLLTGIQWGEIEMVWQKDDIVPMGIVSISLKNCNLSGVIDVSGFNELKSIDISNTSIELRGCSPSVKVIKGQSTSITPSTTTTPITQQGRNIVASNPDAHLTLTTLKGVTVAEGVASVQAPCGGLFVATVTHPDGLTHTQKMIVR